MRGWEIQKAYKTHVQAWGIYFPSYGIKDYYIENIVTAWINLLTLLQ